MGFELIGFTFLFDLTFKINLNLLIQIFIWFYLNILFGWMGSLSLLFYWEGVFNKGGHIERGKEEVVVFR